jgi:hypothetical protein
MLKNSPKFLQLKDSLSCSQKLRQVQPSLVSFLAIYFPNVRSNIILFSLGLNFWKDFFPFQSYFEYNFIFCWRSTFFHMIHFNIVTIAIISEQQNLWGFSFTPYFILTYFLYFSSFSSILDYSQIFVETKFHSYTTQQAENIPLEFHLWSSSGQSSCNTSCECRDCWT